MHLNLILSNHTSRLNIYAGYADIMPEEMRVNVATERVYNH